MCSDVYGLMESRFASRLGERVQKGGHGEGQEGIQGSVRGVVLADIVAGNLKLVRSSFAVVEACLRQIQFHMACIFD